MSRRTRFAVVIAALAAMLSGIACDSGGREVKAGEAGVESEVRTRGSAEVVAELVEILGREQWNGEFPSNDLGYDYAYVLEYRVLETLRGRVEDETILIAHYNPLKPRASVSDARCPAIGGTLRRFRPGDEHHLALEVPLDAHYMGPLINKYFGEEESEGPIYWAVWTDRFDR